MIKEKSTFRAKALCLELVTNSRRRVFARDDDFFFIISGSERNFIFRVSLTTLPTLATLVRDNRNKQMCERSVSDELEALNFKTSNSC